MKDFKYYIDMFQIQVHGDSKVLNLAALVIGQPQTCKNTIHLSLNKIVLP